MAKGWLEIKPSFVAKMFGLKGTEKARFDMDSGSILIELDDDKLKEEGQVVYGIAHSFKGPVVIVPSGWVPKDGSKRAPV